MKKFIKLGIVAVVVGGAAFMWFTGRVDKHAVEQAGRQAYYKTRGGAAQVLKPSAPTKSGPAAAEQCKKNLREIETGKRKVASRRGAGVGAVSVAEVEEALGHRLPRCPGGGKYSLRNLEYLPHCSIGNQGDANPANDHTIRQF